MKIYRDPACTNPHDFGIIYEGDYYYLDVGELTFEERERLIERSCLASFSHFNPLNRICRFRIDGYLGELKIGEETFDVRSKKFQIAQSGSDQFATLLSEIDRIRRGLNFRYDAPTRREVSINPNYQSTPLQRLEFWNEQFSDSHSSPSIARVIERLIAHPHSTIRSRPRITPIEMAKKIDARDYARNFGKYETLKIKPRSAISARPACIQTGLGDRFLPKSVVISEPYVSTDTLENRFIKFTLGSIENTCLAVLRDRKSPYIATTDARNLLRRVRDFLSSPFFKLVGELYQFPGHSPVLSGNATYNRIYDAYLRSMRESTDPLQNAKRQLHSSGLKDIATLYEIWTFFKLAEALFGEATLTIASNGTQRGLNQGTQWKSDAISISYNKSFSRQKGSYSLTLRPDITVQIDDKTWLFDAKYKSDRTAEYDDINDLPGQAVAKKVDLHKMHTYVDAITHACSAIALYPGTETSLYPKEALDDISLENVLKGGGVGAIPLTPAAQNSHLSDLASHLRSYL